MIKLCYFHATFCSSRRSSMAVSSSSTAPLCHHPKTSSPSCSGREPVSSWGGSLSPTVTWHKPWARLPTMHRRAPTKPSALSISSLTPKGLTGWQWWGEERCGPPPPPGSSAASQPSASSLCRNLRHQSKLIFINSVVTDVFEVNNDKSVMWLLLI